MKQIEFKSNYGFFAYRMTAEVGDEVNEATTALAIQGMANIAYRVAGSAVDKALGVKTKKDKKFEKRTEVLFEERTAETINATVSAKLVELEKESPVLAGLKLSFAVVGQHEYGSTGTATKEATELWEKVQALDAEKFAGALAKLGFTKEQIEADDYEDEDGIAACAAHIRREKEEAKKRAATGLGL